MMRKSMLPISILVLAVALGSKGLAQDQDAKQILQRAIKAAGGTRSLDRLKSPMMWMERGTFYGMGEGLQEPYLSTCV